MGYSFVGYFEDVPLNNLPQIRQGIFKPARSENEAITDKMKLQQNLMYAKNYHLLKDMKIIIDHLKYK